jgi:hypothetical protein
LYLRLQVRGRLPLQSLHLQELRLLMEGGPRFALGGAARCLPGN